MSFKVKDLAEKKPICYIVELFNDISCDIYSYGAKRDVQKPNIFVVSYAILVVLFCLSFIAWCAISLLSAVDSTIMAILFIVLLVCFIPFASMLLIFYYGYIFVLTADSLLNLIAFKSEKFKKCVPYISFYLGGLLGLILPILIIIIKD